MNRPPFGFAPMWSGPTRPLLGRLWAPVWKTFIVEREQVTRRHPRPAAAPRRAFVHLFVAFRAPGDKLCP